MVIPDKFNYFSTAHNLTGTSSKIDTPAARMTVAARQLNERSEPYGSNSVKVTLHRNGFIYLLATSLFVITSLLKNLTFRLGLGLTAIGSGGPKVIDQENYGK